MNLFVKLIERIKTKFRKEYEKYYFRQLRKKLKNDDFSLFSPNCYAGFIYHRLGKQFASPTINMLFPSKKQYLKFLQHLKYYLEQELVFIDDENYNCPVALLDNEIKLVFNHDTDENVVLKNWNRRKKRVNYDNLFFIFDDIADAEKEDLIEFNKLECKNKVILSAKEYDDIDNVVTIKKYKKTGGGYETILT